MYETIKADIKRVGKSLRRAWKSHTINWALALTIAGYVEANTGQVIPFVQRYLPSAEPGEIVMAIGLLMIVLRFKTDKPVAEK